MPHIIADTPSVVSCLVRKEFTQNFQSGQGEYLRAHLIGIRCQAAVSVAKPGMNTGDCGLSLTVEKPSCLPLQAVEGENPSGDGA